MNTWLILLLVLPVSYLLGAIPFGLLIGKIYGKDIRQEGSRNIGATNVTRCIGPWQGKLCFLLDFLKGTVPTAATLLWLLPGVTWAPLAAGAAAVAGHMFPVYLKFKGGKGVSTAAGVAVALAPYPLLAAAVTWGAVFLLFRYVSLASITASIMLPLAAVFCGIFHWGTESARSGITILFLALTGALSIYRHRTNIQRLCNGTENRFVKKEEK